MKVELIFMGMKETKKSIMTDLKKLRFVKPQILNIFCQNFRDFILG